jgi:hypothetical protein
MKKKEEWKILENKLQTSALAVSVTPWVAYFDFYVTILIIF